MKRSKVSPTLDNVLMLWSRQLKNFKGESRRSYQKAFASFQFYCISNYPLTHLLDKDVLQNWVLTNLISGLSFNTVSFYLDKLSSLYSGIAGNITGGKQPFFKEVKVSLKSMSLPKDFADSLSSLSHKLKNIYLESKHSGIPNILINAILNFPSKPFSSGKETLNYLWCAIALKAGIKGETLRGISPEIPKKLEVLNMFRAAVVSEVEKKTAIVEITRLLGGEEENWFAMRLRPNVRFQQVLERFSRISDLQKMPEIFYPDEEIAKRIGRKVVWQGKPIIRDIVFFRKRKSEIYNMFTHLYDLAWCYKQPGGKSGNYAVIPDKAMDDFRKALGFLSPGMEVFPKGEVTLKPGDKVVIVNGENAGEYGEILKKPSIDDDGNKIYRVTLLNGSGRWEIGIDARLLQPVI